MSHYTEIKLALKTRDKGCVVRALELCGFPQQQIEVHDEAQPLRDFRGSLTKYRWTDHQDERFKDGDKAHIIVRAGNMGDAQNDMGIYLDGDESVMFLCDFARTCRSNACKNPVAKAMGNYAPWLERFQDEYAAQETLLHHHERGQHAERVLDEDGTVYVYANA